jgi:cell division protein FtsL
MSGTPSVAPKPRHSPKPEHALKEVHRPRRALRRTTVAVSVLAIFLLFGLVGFQAVIVNNQSTLDRLDSEIADAEKTNQVLRLEVARSQAPERIRAAALQILGMVEPQTVVYLEPISIEELAPVVDDAP